MGFFDFFTGPDINQGLKEYHEASGAVLLDVRTPEEYRDGHIPGSRNLPLQSLEQAGKIIQNRNTPVFVYCRSGSRSSQARSILSRMGYSNVKNLGGIISYSGQIEY